MKEDFSFYVIVSQEFFTFFFVGAFHKNRTLRAVCVCWCVSKVILFYGA